MLKKTLLKNTKEFLEKNFSENFFLLKKSNKKQRKLLLAKGKIVKQKLFKFKLKNLKLLYQNDDNLSEKFYEKSQNLNKAFSIEKYNNFLVSMHMIKFDFEKRQTRNSDFKNKLKEKKKLSILYGNLSNKQIKKNLQEACKLRGNTGNNLLTLLETRLDVILYRALFFPSIKSARQWINCNKILVNSKYINVASYKTNFGDIISVAPNNKKCIATNILKFLLYYNLYNVKNTMKQLEYKQNQLLSNSKKKFIFNLLKSNIGSKKKFSFFLPKHLNVNNVKSKKSKEKSLFSAVVDKSSEIYLQPLVAKYQKKIFGSWLPKKQGENLYVSQAKISFFTKNLTKALPLLNGIYIMNKINMENISKNLFFKKHHYIISNFYFTLLQNQIKPINRFLLKQNINKLAKIFQINKLNFYIKKYKILNKSISPTILLVDSKTSFKIATLVKNSISSPFGLKKLRFFSSLSLLKWHFFFYKEKLNTKAEIFLSSTNKKILQQSKEIVNLLLNNNFISKNEKKCCTNNLLNLNLIKYHDILFFLKLKNYFFRKREIFISENFPQKINFKPLNLEISYKTLTIIHLYPSQKIVFPCSLDIELLLKGNI